MTRSILAHFDGKVIVPDEPVDLPVNEPLRVDFATTTNGVEKIDVEERLRRLEKTFGCVTAPPVPLESMRREELYDE